MIGFFAFCLSSSVIYIINDIFDVEKDKLHPKKCKRPIASGEISIKFAWVLAILLLVVVVTLNYIIAKEALRPFRHLNYLIKTPCPAYVL